MVQLTSLDDYDEWKQPPNTKADKDCSFRRVGEQSTIRGRTDNSTLVKILRREKKGGMIETGSKFAENAN